MPPGESTTARISRNEVAWHVEIPVKNLKMAFLEQDTIPFCDQCGGIVKTATISFGQSMPESEMGRAHARNDLSLLVHDPVPALCERRSQLAE